MFWHTFKCFSINWTKSQLLEERLFLLFEIALMGVLQGVWWSRQTTLSLGKSHHKNLVPTLVRSLYLWDILTLKTLQTTFVLVPKPAYHFSRRVKVWISKGLEYPLVWWRIDNIDFLHCILHSYSNKLK